MPKPGLESDIVDPAVYESNVRRFHDAGVRLPTFGELADPTTIPEDLRTRVAAVDPDGPHSLNLFRVHWYNGADREHIIPVPDHLEIPPQLSGVPARIVLLLGDRFPMIRAHKVLAAYGCLAPRLITGQFDPAEHRAIWPSTGNYCRGGVAISRILGCHGVAVLPEGMSEERFEWLERWVLEPGDVIRTPGSESNVKEIYDKCAELEGDPANIIFNQFSEFGNYLAHYLCTGRAAEKVFTSLRQDRPRLRLAAFVAATGSAGTLAAGDHLKERYGAKIVAAEALECPTLLYCGFGEHNIQGIGDKHIPLIHNVFNTDLVAAVSDRATDALGVLFDSTAGKEYLTSRRGVPAETVERLDRLGFSAICNLIAAIKVARYYDLGEDDVILTVATDGAELYRSEHRKILARDFPDGFDTISGAEVFGRHLLGTATDHLLELSLRDRQRIFNLGYFTWVEQRGVALEEFEQRREASFWHRLRDLLPAWDAMIEELNRRARMAN